MLRSLETAQNILFSTYPRASSKVKTTFKAFEQVLNGNISTLFFLSKTRKNCLAISIAQTNFSEIFTQCEIFQVFFCKTIKNKCQKNRFEFLFLGGMLYAIKWESHNNHHTYTSVPCQAASANNSRFSTMQLYRPVWSLLFLASFCKAQISFGGGETTSAAASSNSCTSPDGLEGECTYLLQCPTLLQLLTKRPLLPPVITFLRQSVCGFTRNLPDVCCPKSRPLTTTTTTSRTTTLTER